MKTVSWIWAMDTRPLESLARSARRIARHVSANDPE